MAKPIIWDEPLPDCDICVMADGVHAPAPYDGKTKSGPWANMCESHLIRHGYPQSDELTFQRVPREG